MLYIIPVQISFSINIFKMKHLFSLNQSSEIFEDVFANETKAMVSLLWFLKLFFGLFIIIATRRLTACILLLCVVIVVLILVFYFISANQCQSFPIINTRCHPDGQFCNRHPNTVWLGVTFWWESPSYIAPNRSAKVSIVNDLLLTPWYGLYGNNVYLTISASRTHVCICPRFNKCLFVFKDKVLWAPSLKF